MPSPDARHGSSGLRGDERLDPTPHSELNAVLRALVDGIASVLGESLVGAYLQGSFAVGGFDAHSDVDFAVVTEEELSDDQIEGLQRLHRRIYEHGSEWAKHLEGSYFPLEILRPLSGCGRPLWYLEHGRDELVRSAHCNTVVVRWVLREHGVVLAGPPAAALIDPIAVDVLRGEIRETMRDWGREILASPERFRNRFYQSFIVLSYCKMLHDLRSGRIGSKREGAAWAQSALDGSWVDLIDRAWGGRPNPSKSISEPPDPHDFEMTLEFIDYVNREADVGEPSIDMIIRPAEPDDAPVCHELRRRAFLEVFSRYMDETVTAAGADAYTPAEFGRYLAEMPTSVAVAGEQVVGFCTVRRRDGDEAELLWLYVGLEARGKGVGSRLARHAEELAHLHFPGVSRIVLVTAVPDYNQAFYERLGYRRVGMEEIRYPKASAFMVKLGKEIAPVAS